MKILAVETSGVTFSAALAENGQLVSEVFWRSGLNHSETLIPAVRGIISKSGWKLRDMDKIAVSTGPGSFTGIRVGMAFARTAAQSLDIPLVGVNTLDILAANLAGRENIIPAIDALRNEVYVKKGNRRIEIEPLGGFLNGLKKNRKKFHIIGSAVLSYGREIKKALGSMAVLARGELNYPRAGKLALMAGYVDGQNYEDVRPLYVRRSWAEEKGRS